MIRVSTALLSLLLYSGCVPSSQVYYKPTDAAFAFDYRHCGIPYVGYADDIGDSRSVLITVWLEDDGVAVAIQFELQSDDLLRFSGDTLEVIHNESRFVGVLAAKSPAGIVENPITEGLTPDDPPTHYPDPDSDRMILAYKYTLRSEIKGDFSGEILLVVPRFFINDVETEISPIRMMRVKKSDFEYC